MAKRKSKTDVSDIEAMIRRADKERYVLRLYVTGSSPKSAAAISNIRSLCEQHLPGRYDLEVIDLYQQPAEAQNAQIIAAPTLVKSFPSPPKRLVGDLSNRDKVLVGLNIRPADAPVVAPPRVKWVEL